MLSQLAGAGEFSHTGRFSNRVNCADFYYYTPAAAASLLVI